MALITITVKLKIAGPSTGPLFDLYALPYDPVFPYVSDIQKNDLLNGYTLDIPEGTTSIKLSSKGICNKSVEIGIDCTQQDTGPVIEPTPTPTVSPTQGFIPPTPSPTATLSPTVTPTPSKSAPLPTPCLVGTTNVSANCSGGQSGTFTFNAGFTSVTVTPNGYFYSGYGSATGALKTSGGSIVQTFTFSKSSTGVISYSPSQYVITSPGTYVLEVNTINCSFGSGVFSLGVGGCIA